MIPVFLGSDIISEYQSDDTAIHIIERRCRLNIDVPYLLKKIAGVEHLLFIQKNALDRKKRTLLIEANNESFSSRIVIFESCKYFVHPENADWTCFEQDASLDIKSFFGFESTVEKIAMKQYTANIKKGKEVIVHYINEILTLGKTHIPPWTPPNKSNTKAITPTNESQDNPIIERENSSGSGFHTPETSPRMLHRSLKEDINANGANADSLDASENRCIDKPVFALGPLHLEDRSELASSRSSLNLGASAQNIFVDCQEPVDKLDADYIARCLGELTPYEESKLVQLQKMLQGSHKGKIPSDSHILRFLRAREFNLEKAREMLYKSLAWRKLHGIDLLLSTYTPAAVINEYYSGGWHYHDKDGRPLYILRLGHMDVKGLMKSAAEDALLKHVLYVNEEGIRRCEEATKRLGHPVTNCTCIVDLEGLSMRHLWRPGIRALLRIIEVVEANYPETMGFLLIVRAPRVFPVLWTLISPFIDENTSKKFLIYGGKDYQGSSGLVGYVDKKYVPDFLGGDCFCHVPEGGMVPKCLYIQEDHESEKDRSPDDAPFALDGLYHTAYVVRDFAHEVMMHVPQKGCVITWDFDILKGDMTFTVMRLRRPYRGEPHEHRVSGAVGGIGSTQYVDKHWSVGVDISVIEPPVVCKVGDSIQGSHVTGHAGSYILQFKHFDWAKSFDLFTHKSKVMYYTQVLPSASFKGSMTSLQSSQSGFSQLSSSTGAPSMQSRSTMSMSSCPSS